MEAKNARSGALEAAGPVQHRHHQTAVAEDGVGVENLVADRLPDAVAGACLVMAVGASSRLPTGVGDAEHDPALGVPHRTEPATLLYPGGKARKPPARS